MVKETKLKNLDTQFTPSRVVITDMTGKELLVDPLLSNCTCPSEVTMFHISYRMTEREITNVRKCERPGDDKGERLRSPPLTAVGSCIVVCDLEGTWGSDINSDFGEDRQTSRIV